LKIQLLETALQDLMEGFDFYERQECNLGAYFLDSLFSDIDSLLIYAGIHPIYFKAYEVLAKCSAIRVEQAVLSASPSNFYGRHGFLH
jgi:hypothetical protein